MNGRAASCASRAAPAGFGYDPVFLPAGSARTAAELRPEEKDAVVAPGPGAGRVGAVAASAVALRPRHPVQRPRGRDRHGQRRHDQPRHRSGEQRPPEHEVHHQRHHHDVQQEDLVGDLAQPDHRSAGQQPRVPAARTEHQRRDDQRRDRGVQQRLRDRRPRRDRPEKGAPGRCRHQQVQRQRHRDRDSRRAAGAECLQHRESHTAHETRRGGPEATWSRSSAAHRCCERERPRRGTPPPDRRARPARVVVATGRGTAPAAGDRPGRGARRRKRPRPPCSTSASARGAGSSSGSRRCRSG